MKRIQKEKYREREVFAAWKTDTADTVTQIMNHDKNRQNLRKICETPQEYQKISDTIIQNLTLLTDLYHYLQAKSDRYPWISFYAVRKHFF